MSERFYLNWPLNPGPVELTGPEARHLATVCRLRAGAEVCLFNGDGHEYPARVAEISKKAVLLDVTGVQSPARELSFELEIAAPIPKGDRAQFLVENLTELGVATYVPVLHQHGRGDPGEHKLDKLRRYVVEASKQCGRNTLMSVEQPIDWAKYCERGEAGEVRMIAHPRAANTWCGETSKETCRIRCAVGPEGGFTDQEVALALASNWQLVSLGSRILRVETAALALAVIAVTTFAGDEKRSQ